MACCDIALNIVTVGFARACDNVNIVTTERDNSELNVRGMDAELVQQVKIAALRRGGKAPLRRWVSQALAQALRNEASGPRPRLKLCAGCVRANEELAKRVKPPMMGPAGSISPTHAPSERAYPDQAGALSPFADLIGKIDDDPGADLPLAPSQEAAAESTDGTESPAALQPPTISRYGIEVAPGLWIGGDADYERWENSRHLASWSVLQAAKEPWHRLMVGYETKSAPECAERLFARRENRMALNLIDVRKLGPGGTAYVPAEVVSAALNFIDERLMAGDGVLVHSSHGKSRAPGLAFLYMRRHGLLPFQFEAAMELFRKKYPDFEPGAGMLATLEQECRLRGDVCGGKEAHAHQAGTNGDLQPMRA
jgi:hypothetical protein